MTGTPRLADIQCCRLQFQPGDRVLVRVYQPLDREELKKLRRTVERWAGDGVAVLIVDCTKFEVALDHTAG